MYVCVCVCVYTVTTPTAIENTSQNWPPHHWAVLGVFVVDVCSVRCVRTSYRICYIIPWRHGMTTFFCKGKSELAHMIVWHHPTTDPLAVIDILMQDMVYVGQHETVQWEKNGGWMTMLRLEWSPAYTQLPAVSAWGVAIWMDLTTKLYSLCIYGHVRSETYTRAVFLSRIWQIFIEVKLAPKNALKVNYIATESISIANFVC